MPLLLALVAALAAGSARAQTAPPPPPAPAGGGGQVTSSAATPAPGAEEAPLAEGDLRVRAESYEQVEKGRWEARGLVDLRLGQMRIQADRADVVEETLADGSTRRKLIAEGNVVFIRGEERLSGDRVEMDETGRGFFENAVGYVEPGVFVEGRRVERVDDDTYKVEGGRFTSCAQPNPRWNFSASSARIEVDDKIVARNAVFHVKGVPAFYLPYIYYPISRDGRSTGFLFPHFGYSQNRGYSVGTGFYWVLGRSADQTFFGENYSRIGYGFGHELRYAAGSPSRGTFRTYLFRVKPLAPTLDPGSGEVIDEGREASTEWDVDWNALQMLPGRVRAVVNVRQYSDLLFNQRYQDNFNFASSRSERWAGSLEKDLGLAVLSAYAEKNGTYFGTDFTRINSRLPGVNLRRFPKQVGFGGVVFGLEAGGDRIQFGDQDRVDTWSRWDFAPVVSRPFTLSFLDFNPSFGYRYTRYGSRLGVDEAGESAILPGVLKRSFYETALEMRGPTFSRVFDTPGFGYSQRFKHTIGPEITWTYRSRVDDFNAIPKFDGEDYYVGTNELRYALVQRFFAKRAGPTGRAVPYEFFSWRLQQTYYVQINEGQDNFDPNYSSSAFGPGFKPEHLSPLMSRMRLRPTPELSLDYQAEYDVNFKQWRRMGAFTSLMLPRLSLTGGWSRAVRLDEDPSKRVVGSHTLRGSMIAELVPQRLTLEGSADYDLVNDILYSMRGQLRYSIQCCGFAVEQLRFNWNGRQDVQWRINVSLANVGSVGNFGAADMAGSRQGLGSFR